MTTTTVLTSTQLRVLETLRADFTGDLVRVPGGYWTTHAIATLHNDNTHVFNQRNAPFWCGIATVRVLEREGFLTRMHRFIAEWADDRTLTERGRNAQTSQ